MAQVRSVLCPHCTALLDSRSGFDYVTVAPDIHVIACHYCNKALGPYSLTVSEATSEAMRTPGAPHA